MDNECRICSGADIASGKDKLLFEDDFCQIVENGDTDGYSRRISLAIRRHIADPKAGVEGKAVVVLRNYLTKVEYLDGASFFIRKTMRTYPDHFHIHAYILPRL